MPNETLITEIENALSEVVRLGGENERSQVVPNLTVQDANPTNLTGFVIVSDDRDGDNILAKKVPDVIYTNNDLVNVLFPKGGEAIAFQQGSQSANAGIWEIVPNTTTDIFYNKGSVGIGDSAVPDAILDVVTGDGTKKVIIAKGAFGQTANLFETQTSAGLVLTHIEDDGNLVVTDATSTLPTAAMLRTGSPAGVIPWALRQNAADSANPVLTQFETLSGDIGIVSSGIINATATFFVNADANRQLALSANNELTTPHILIDTNGDVGIKTIAPTTALDVTGTVTITDDILHAGDTDTKISFTDDDVEITAGGLSMLKLTETTQDLIILGPGSGDVDIDFNGDMFLQGSSGHVMIGTTTNSGERFSVQGVSSQELTVAFFTGDGDGTDNASFVIYGVGTPGSVANRERLIFGYNVPSGSFRFLSEAQGTGTLRPIIFETEGNTNQLYIDTDGDVGIGTSTTSAQLHVDQASTTTAIPVLLLDQANTDEPFTKYVGEAAAANLSRSIVDEGDVTTATRIGWIKHEIDDVGNQVTDGDYFVPFYTLA